MAVIAMFMVLPLVCVGGWLLLLVTGPRKGLAVSLGLALGTIAAGFWAIVQSRSSTAGLGILILPGAASVSGALAFAYARLLGSPRAGIRAAAWLCLAGSVSVPGYLIAGGFQTQAKNRAQDQTQAEYSEKIKANRETIRALLRDNEGREQLVLDAEIETHLTDGAFLIPALETAFVSEDRLDRLGSSPDLNVALMVARNPRTRAGTLARIYRSSSYPPYFFQALSQHKNTPVDILQALADGPSPTAAGTFDPGLASNPSAPREVLMRIASSNNHHNLRVLLGNDALDCEMLRAIEPKLTPDDRNNIEATEGRTEALNAKLCAAK